MKIFEPMNWDALVSEYGVRAKRLLPWPGMTPPFGAAWVMVDPGTVSLDHVNEPEDEEELFICATGRAVARVGERSLEIAPGDVVYLPSGVRHYLENPYEDPCCLYCIWWNHRDMTASLASRERKT